MDIIVLFVLFVYFLGVFSNLNYFWSFLCIVRSSYRMGVLC